MSSMIWLGNPMKTTANDDTKQRAPYDIRYDGDYIYSSFMQSLQHGLV